MRSASSPEPTPPAPAAVRRGDLREQRSAASVMPWERIAPRPASRSPRGLARRLGAKVLTMGAMAFVALLTVGMSIPASAFGDASATAGGTATASAEGGAQHLSVTDALEPASSRDAYSATTAAQFAAAKAAEAAKQAARASRAPIGLSFNPSGTGPVRWPFAVSVKLGPGFGAPATCSTCSRVHQGQDFLAPTGTTLYSIADGVVVEHSESGSFGNHVVIRHTIDGQTVESLYAHMISGSSPLQVGQTVQVGQAIGLLGSTGATTAPHLHLQIAVNGGNVDPYAYLKAHAG